MYGTPLDHRYWAALGIQSFHNPMWYVTSYEAICDGASYGGLSANALVAGFEHEVIKL